MKKYALHKFTNALDIEDCMNSVIACYITKELAESNPEYQKYLKEKEEMERQYKKRIEEDKNLKETEYLKKYAGFNLNQLSSEYIRKYPESIFRKLYKPEYFLVLKARECSLNDVKEYSQENHFDHSDEYLSKFTKWAKNLTTDILNNIEKDSRTYFDFLYDTEFGQGFYIEEIEIHE